MKCCAAAGQARLADAVKAGKDPLNLAFEPGTEPVTLEAGQFLSGEASAVAGQDGLPVEVGVDPQEAKSWSHPGFKLGWDV